ncbi:hypothetical protein [Paracoccus denitrificans]|jgi:hypothetical protein|uniref:Type I secretion protein ATPase n=1 Tax=Paracoccus denitrificans (strain Pd 1222) TaxID=318586 RepID=A1BA57_PARDP|nr:hypothetical protein [Paracoccus denitrificans]ABL72401.1 conserved hypothetical protein [Paracoccus denitrificans PD1222]MBB4628531.1 hypothetical protein [Paracoccus denitrificans]MCU7430168.1 hypothetical protein [Paracoccus denitrificans]QAR28959.1 hypothetical protein EO213_22060 [Paracoccus denitrificans]UPV97113.1 hypothetical protein M0K93_22165 [Paracoccus denitrificans]
MFTIDAADEAIWHFIGLFHIGEERGRMRIEYDRLTPKKADPDLGPVEPLDLSGQHPYRPLDHLPDIPYVPPHRPVEGLAADPRPPLMELETYFPRFSVSPEVAFLATLSGGIPWSATPPGRFLTPEDPNWTLPVPGSVAVIVIQKTRLADDDQMNADGIRGGLVDAHLLAGRLEALAAQAGQLGIALPVAMPADEPAFRLIAETFRQAGLPQAEAAGAQVHARQGADVEGQYLNGAAVDTRPDIDALMPAYRKEQAAEQAREAQENAAPPRHEGPSSAGSAFATGPGEGGQGHDLILGNNTLVNQVTINSAAPTAPVIVVAAGVYSYNIVSQTNVWSDSDVLAGLFGAAHGQPVGAPTQALNYASYASFSNPMPVVQGDGEAPQYWVTATLEGSLISMNWIEQYNLMSDNDIASVTVHANQTLLLMGQNGALNQVSLLELGMSYDLIIIDGQIINLNTILQTNVLLDDDRITVSDGLGARISSGDNLLINDATIVQVGLSGIVATSPGHDAMLAGAAAGEVALPQSVLDDPAFQGLGVVRVLHVKGDMVSVNVIRQTNVLGDADQIEVYRDDLLAGGGEIGVVSGSNLLVNAAVIAEFGVDATIHSGGEVYSDALLHQAELVMTDDPLMPAPPSGLASEAVLFLAEGMLGEDDADAGFVPIGANADVPADIMQTVLA